MPSERKTPPTMRRMTRVERGAVRGALNRKSRSRWICFIPMTTAVPVIGSTVRAELERVPDAAHESFLAEKNALCREVEATDPQDGAGAELVVVLVVADGVVALVPPQDGEPEGARQQIRREDFGDGLAHGDADAPVKSPERLRAAPS